ncbi:MAG: alkaline phosphatase, partial [Halothiobacillaceae bacterium]
GANAVDEAKKLYPNVRRAKNVILFVGDGMGISTVTAARILAGQLQGKSGEENQLTFEKLPYLALSKTYSVNQQTPDSAPTMTAMVTGVKTNDGVLSVNQHVQRGDCNQVQGNTLATILEQAEKAGKATGIVTTARLTHATPAANYAHSPERDWESDAEIPAACASFADIARQLIEFPHGDGLEVAMGGGRDRFLPNTALDPEDTIPPKKGLRKDGRNLTAEWLTNYPNAAYAWNKEQFDAINPATTRHLLGLFERSHMEYEQDRTTDTGGEPSLSEMTAKAIDMLKQNNKGFYLHVESGRIDHGHHAGNASRALTDTIELAKAVKVAMENTDPKETLIIVTADHSHVFTMAGYPKRGNNILGKVVSTGDADGDYAKDALGLPYTTLGYANGPGYTGTSNSQPEGSKMYPHNPSSYAGITTGRPNLTTTDTTAPSYLQEAAVPMQSETHAGEDVAIYATGPKAYLFRGVMEQNTIFHVMKEAFGF